MHNWYWNSEWHTSMMIGMAIFWILVIVAGVLAFRYVTASGRLGAGSRHPDSPETILKQRYARGEIDRNEYEHRLTEIRK